MLIEILFQIFSWFYESEINIWNISYFFNNDSKYNQLK